MLSLLEPGSCPDPKKDYAVARVTAHPCQAKSTTRVTCCHYNSITYSQHITNWRQTMKVPKEECWRAVRDRTIVLLNRTLKIATNGHLSTTIITKGGLDQQFNSTYGHFVSRGKNFLWSFEQTTLEVNVHPVKARYDQRTDQIVLNNGVRGQFSPGVLHDNQMGTIVWMQKPTDCKDSVSQVYLGPAKIYEFLGGQQGSKLDLLGNSIVILDNDVGTQD